MNVQTGACWSSLTPTVQAWAEDMKPSVLPLSVCSEHRVFILLFCLRHRERLCNCTRCAAIGNSTPGAITGLNATVQTAGSEPAIQHVATARLLFCLGEICALVFGMVLTACNLRPSRRSVKAPYTVPIVTSEHLGLISA